MIRKHIFPLAFKPKIPGVRSGLCTQSIREISYTKPRNKGDWIMFFGWSGEPYKSKWSFRTKYMKINQTFNIRFVEHSGFIVVRVADPDDNFNTISKAAMQTLSILDGFRDIGELLREFKKMYGDKFLEMVFTVIRWNPTIIFEEPKEDQSQRSIEEYIGVDKGG